VKSKETELKKWKIKLYKDKNGKCPVADFIKTLPLESKRKIHSAIEYLTEKGTELHRPQSALLRDGIRELRVQLKGKNTRTLYFFCYENYIVLTHIFIKTTQLVPEKEIDKALAYKEDFLQRYNKDNIKGA